MKYLIALFIGLFFAGSAIFTAWCLAQNVDVHGTPSPTPEAANQTGTTLTGPNTTFKTATATPHDTPKLKIDSQGNIASDGINFLGAERPRKHLTRKQWEKLVANDPVLQFVEQVNERATKDPLWNQNYALALYRAFGDEARKRIIEKHGVTSYEMEPRP